MMADKRAGLHPVKPRYSHSNPEGESIPSHKQTRNCAPKVPGGAIYFDLTQTVTTVFSTNDVLISLSSRPNINNVT